MRRLQPKGQPPLAPPLLDSPPVLQNPGPDGVTVVAAVSGLSTGWVEFGTTPQPGNGWQRADDSRHGMLPLSGRVHRVRMAGLRPATRYWYRVAAAPINWEGPYKIKRGEAVFSPVHSFTTLDEGRGGSVAFNIINDTHENVETLKGAMGLLEQKGAALNFWNGDIFNDVRSDDQIVGNVLRPAGSAYASGTPLCFVSGNHDVRGIHARSLERFIDVPRERRYYTLRQGPVAFIVLDTGEDKADSHAVYAGLNDFARYRDEQRAWLAETVRREDVRGAAFRVAVLHIPLFGKAESVDSRDKWAGLLAEAKIDAAIHGHVHEFLYTPPEASHAWGQLVGGGPKPEAATVIRGEADEKRLALIAFNLGGKEIGNYEFRKS